MEPIDHFVADVEASGEDKKHKPLGWVDYGDLIAMSNTPWDVCHVTFLEEPEENTAPIYGQSQLDAAVAEAVAKEREPLRTELVECYAILLSFYYETLSRNNLMSLAGERIEAVEKLLPSVKSIAEAVRGPARKDTP